MRIENDIKLDFDDVLIRPKRSTLKSRKDVDLTRTYKFKHTNISWVGIPVMAANMTTVGTFEMATELMEYSMPTVVHKFYSIKDWKIFLKDNKASFLSHFVIPSIGANDEDFEKYKKINSIFPDSKFICIDVANGYGEYFVEFVEKVKNRYPDKIVIAGNAVTGEMVEQLILSGASVVKVGISQGAACSTMMTTGIGYPQLSAAIECADAAHGLGGHIISDGGCRTPGDIAKAFCCNSDFVMIGGMLAGHDESGGEITEEYEQDGYKWKNGGYVKNIVAKEYKEFYGMSSDTAQIKHYGEQKNYRASEGVTMKVPYKGPVENTIREVLGGLRSTMTYIGSSRLKDASKCTTFIRVNRQHRGM